MNDYEKLRENAGKNDNGKMPMFPISHGALTFVGLTKREVFAAMAMSGWLASFAPDATAGEQGVAIFAVKCADALLAELAKEKKE